MDYSFREFEIFFPAVRTFAALDPALGKKTSLVGEKDRQKHNGSGLYSCRKRCRNGATVKCPAN